MTGTGWRQAREAAGKTLRAFAKEVGISAPFQSYVEHGRRRYSPKVEARARAVLGLDPAPDPAPRCVVCEGPLKEETGYAYPGDPMHLIIGPGSKSQMMPTYALWCPRCGLDYRHPPAPASPSEHGGEDNKEADHE